MIVGICRGGGLGVWEFDLPLAEALIIHRRQHEYQVIHGWWTGIEWGNCVKRKEQLEVK